MTPAPTHAFRDRPELSTVRVLAREELRDALRSRTFWAYGLGFLLLAGALTGLALPGAQVTGFGGLGRTGASLVAVAQLVVPLMGLTLGAQAVAGARERGALGFVLSQPVSRSEVFLGTVAGLGAALLAVVSAGFGTAGLVAAIRGHAGDPWALVVTALACWLLALAMLALGVLVSALVRRSGAALGGAVLVWLVAVLGADLGLMGTAIATRMPLGALLAAAIANPVEAFRLLAFQALRGSLDVLGPAGSYAVDRYGDALGALLVTSLVLWFVLPAGLAWWAFLRRVDA